MFGNLDFVWPKSEVVSVTRFFNRVVIDLDLTGTVSAALKVPLLTAYAASKSEFATSKIQEMRGRQRIEGRAYLRCMSDLFWFFASGVASIFNHKRLGMSGFYRDLNCMRESRETRPTGVLK